MAKVISIMFRGIQYNKEISSRRKIWFNFSDKKVSISVPSNIAEGYGRKTTPDYIRSLYIAYGSNCELETQILLSGDLNYIETKEMKKLSDEIVEVERMLKALIKSLEKKHLNPYIATRKC